MNQKLDITGVARHKHEIINHHSAILISQLQLAVLE